MGREKAWGAEGDWEVKKEKEIDWKDGKGGGKVAERVREGKEGGGLLGGRERGEGCKRRDLWCMTRTHFQFTSAYFVDDIRKTRLPVEI